jgi:hypothetical protein
MILLKFAVSLPSSACPYRSGRSRQWIKSKKPAVKREAEEDWGRDRWR